MLTTVVTPMAPSPVCVMRDMSWMMVDFCAMVCDGIITFLVGKTHPKTEIK